METVRPILCLGEVIVDLICVRPLAVGEAPDRLLPFPGGALANVAVAAARAGAPSALASGVGNDVWGRWIERRLELDGVRTEWLARLEDADTPLGVAFLDGDGEPDFRIYGEHIGPTMATAGERLDEAIAASGALVIGSNTMVGPTEREVTRRALKLARTAGLPVLLDPNFRPNRWTDPERAVRFCRELALAATVVKCNRAEAELMTGRADPSEAARSLAAEGVELVVVTDGAGTILTAGAAGETFSPPPAEVVSPLGAGDAFMGALAAGLAGVGWDLARAGETLAAAAEAAARACRSYGAQN